MNDKREYRSFRADLKERHLQGLAIVWNDLSQDLGGFQERILPTACDRTLEEHPLVLCLKNHDSNHVLGSTGSGTLKLSVTERGLFYDLDIAATTAGNDLIVSVQRGDLDSCSFGFTVVSDRLIDNGKLPIREVSEIRLFEISVGVGNPAYLSTTSVLRSLEDRRRVRKAKQHRLILDFYKVQA